MNYLGTSVDESMVEEDMNSRKQSVIVHSSSLVTGSKPIYSRNKLLQLRSLDTLTATASGCSAKTMPIDMDRLVDAILISFFVLIKLFFPENRQWMGRVNFLMGRWKVALMMLGKVFCDDVAQESGSILIQLAGFPVKEAKFRKEMEKFRNQQGKDLVLEVSQASDYH